MKTDTWELITYILKGLNKILNTVKIQNQYSFNIRTIHSIKHECLKWIQWLLFQGIWISPTSYLLSAPFNTVHSVLSPILLLHHLVWKIWHRPEEDSAQHVHFNELLGNHSVLPNYSVGRNCQIYVWPSAFGHMPLSNHCQICHSGFVHDV